MKRFLFADDGTLTDKTPEVEDYHSGSAVVDVTSSEDAIYIGSRLPFNSLFFDLNVVNTEASVMTVSLWSGNSWEEVAETIDETALAGACLGASGYVTWVPKKTESWVMEDTVGSTGNESVDGLGSVEIYDLYWLKLTFSADLTALTEIGWLGPKFCTDADLVGEYTLFGNSTFRANYESGKTDWEKEIILASRLMISDIENKGEIISGDQLLQRRKLLDACVSQTAMVIFKNLGDDYKDDALRAGKEYYARLNKNNYGADKNNNARLDVGEAKGVSTGVFYK